MTQVQIIGIAVASLVVLLLVIALIVTRRRHASEAPPEPESDSSFLDEAPQDTLSQLGRPEQPVEDVTIDPAVSRARQADNPPTPAPAPAPAGPADTLGPSEPPPASAPPFTPPLTPAPRQAEPGEAIEGGLSLVWGSDRPGTAEAEGSEAAPMVPPPRGEEEPGSPPPEGESSPPSPAVAATPPAAEPPAHAEPVQAPAAPVSPPEPELERAPAAEPFALVPAEEPEELDAQQTGEIRPLEDETTQMPAVGPATGAPAPPATPSEDEVTGEFKPASRKMLLSDIIVTTSSKVVDLDDPEVRRMLADLVTFEIDQAEEFRRQGQTIDAVLQLTEAEKISRALGMSESAERIRTMMKEIQSRS